MAVPELGLRATTKLMPTRKRPWPPRYGCTGARNRYIRRGTDSGRGASGASITVPEEAPQGETDAREWSGLDLKRDRIRSGFLGAPVGAASLFVVCLASGSVQTLILRGVLR